MMCAKSWQTPPRVSKASRQRRRDMGRVRIIGEIGLDPPHQLRRAFEHRAAWRKALAGISRRGLVERREPARKDAMRRRRPGRATSGSARRARTLSHAGVSARGRRLRRARRDARRHRDAQLRMGLVDLRLDDASCRRNPRARARSRGDGVTSMRPETTCWPARRAASGARRSAPRRRAPRSCRS